MGHNKLWKILKEMRMPDHITSILSNLFTGQDTTVRTGNGTADWFQVGKGVCQGCTANCHPTYLTSMQSTSCKLPGWMKHKLESRLPGEISLISDMLMTLPLRQKTKKI